MSDMTLGDLEIELVKRNVSMSLRRESGQWIAYCSPPIFGTGRIGHGRNADIEQAIRAMLDRFDGRKPTMSAGHYILEGHTPVLVKDELMWAHWLDNHDRRIAQNMLPDSVHVSTVFLGIDHSFGRAGPPILFETAIFGGEHDGYQMRYSTWDEAVAGHQVALKLAKGSEVAS